MPPRRATVKGHDPSWPDARLVRECIRGDEEAWAALLDKYKNLIFSIPSKQGMSRDAAADVFQRVCLLLLSELPHLRKAEALPMWLIRVTSQRVPSGGGGRSSPTAPAIEADELDRGGGRPARWPRTCSPSSGTSRRCARRSRASRRAAATS